RIPVRKNSPASSSRLSAVTLPAFSHPAAIGSSQGGINQRFPKLVNGPVLVLLGSRFLMRFSGVLANAN
ncbi:MAG: hypothetical protein KBA32_14435, partial [Propionivibrio sp.]|uniref:hypothetical protein n=1 Tax=Propionivibrio sp. TaxID=2212460 RepID=UPI001B5E73DE